ncbi:MAG: hypothetical protein M3Z23_11260, partial [Acidobacteriota bacterium]|nr:hypothetical protein [Acidobacteriota bacterium]
VNSNPDASVKLWRKVSATENWGTGQQETMRANVRDGTADTDLFKAYMHKLCPEGSALTSKDFLARGADLNGKGDYQGCSSFNPLLIFSRQKENDFEQGALASRNRANAPNRRVMVLLFRIGSRIDFTKWPCPRATEGAAGCVRRFWSDGPSRRTTRLPDKDRKFEDTQDTFACRFYQRISDGSPCHRTVLALRLRLFDRQARPLPKAPYFVAAAGRNTSGFTDPDGFAFVRDVELPATCVVRWSRSSALLDSSKPPDAAWKDFEFEHTVSVDLDAPETASEAPSGALPPSVDSQRLSNMGYIFKDRPEANVQAFQRDAGLNPSGSLADASPGIRRQHDDLVAPPSPHMPNGGPAVG